MSYIFNNQVRAVEERARALPDVLPAEERQRLAVHELDGLRGARGALYMFDSA